jgi:hypothetical protein
MVKDEISLMLLLQFFTQFDFRPQFNSMIMRSKQCLGGASIPMSPAKHVFVVLTIWIGIASSAGAATVEGLLEAPGPTGPLRGTMLAATAGDGPVVLRGMQRAQTSCGFLTWISNLAR